MLRYESENNANNLALTCLELSPQCTYTTEKAVDNRQAPRPLILPQNGLEGRFLWDSPMILIFRRNGVDFHMPQLGFAAELCGERSLTRERSLYSKFSSCSTGRSR